MAGKEALVVCGAAYDTVQAALADLHAIKPLHNDELISQYDAAAIDQKGGKPHVAKRIDRAHICVIPAWFGAGTLARKTSRRRLQNSRPTEPG